MLYGDAANSEVLTHACLERARAGVDRAGGRTGELIVAAVRDLAPNLPIIVRAATEEGVQALADLGAKVVIHRLQGGWKWCGTRSCS